ncbi:hypothetical protein BOTBODRAFT_177252 [Botryobasidium botryosum FD-172 SS1]|uniref:Chromatin modification-related protein EAF7 n=1 Tax=Botryobasidium botryosum (strain FD-172 SS1) TaxID=930990 RepID=A0A067M7A0_BOTB1|nr:hypothetical protein BOTBODRAFT_177252 [Botryobasidium botryosum FD-172 SS1]
MDADDDAQQPFLDTVMGELSFFRAITRARPVGIHRFFHLVSMRQLIREDTNTIVSVDEIWTKLRRCYDLDVLEGLEASDPDADFDSSASSPAGVLSPSAINEVALLTHPYFRTEFALPHASFEPLIAPRRIQEGSATSDDDEVIEMPQPRRSESVRKKSTMAGAGLVGGESDSSELTEGEDDADDDGEKKSARVGSVLTTTEGEVEEEAGNSPGPSSKTRGRKPPVKGKKKGTTSVVVTKGRPPNPQTKKKKKASPFPNMPLSGV